MPHFPRDAKQKNIIFFSGLLTETSSSIEVGKGSDQKYLLNRGVGMVVIECNGRRFTNESLLN